MNYRDRLLWFGKAACLPLAIVAVWALVTETGAVPAYVLPSPRMVLATLMDFFFGGSEQAYSGKFLIHLGQSLYRVAGGFACGAVLGIPLGIVLGYNNARSAHSSSRPSNCRARSPEFAGCRWRWSGSASEPAPACS